MHARKAPRELHAKCGEAPQQDMRDRWDLRDRRDRPGHGHRRGTPSSMRQTADPLGQKRRKSPISSQWVCTLARFPLGTMLTSTRLPPPPRRPTRTRIGYEDMERLLTYPDANNYHQKWKLQLLLEAILRVPASQIRQYLSSRSTTE